MQQHPFRKYAHVLAAATFLLTLGGCERLDQFSTFATAGSQYVQAFHKLITAAGSATIAADSLAFSVARNLDAKGHKTISANELLAADQELATNLKMLGVIDQHASALDNYFDVTTKLSDNSQNAALKKSADGLATSVESLSSQMKGLTIAGKPLNNYVSSATDLTVTSFKVKELDDHLRFAAPKIEEALILQERAIDSIASLMQANLKVALENQEQTAVVEPFTAPFDFTKPPPPLPASWNADREAYLRAKVTLDSLTSAKSAIQKLRTSYEQLIQAKASPSLGSILTDINKMAAFASAVDSSKSFISTSSQK